MDTNIDYKTKDLDLSNQANANSFITNYNKISGSNLNTDSNALIKASNLANVKDIKLPPSTVNNTNTDSLTSIGLTGVEEADTDLKQSEKDLANANKPETVKDGYIAKFLGLNTTIAGKADETAKLQKEQQLAEKTKAANEINNKILSTSRAYEKQIRETERTSRALSGGVNIETQRIAKQRDEQLADLSIQKAVALGDIDTANKIVETVINAKYDPIQAQLDNYEKLISFAQNDMTESEKFEAQNKLNSAKEELDYNRTRLSDAVKEAYSNGQYSLASELNSLDPQSSDFSVKLNSAIAKLTSEVGGDLTFKTLSDGRDVMLDSAGNIIKVIGVGSTQQDKDKAKALEQTKNRLPTLETKISEINTLINDKNLSDAVGTTKFGRQNVTNWFTGGRTNFVSGVQNVISKEVLDTLISLKAAGGTLGAISEKELEILSGSASRIALWEVRDKKTDKVIGYQANEKDFKAELEKIEKSTQRVVDAYYAEQGIILPGSSVGSYNGITLPN